MQFRIAIQTILRRRENRPEKVKISLTEYNQVKRAKSKEKERTVETLGSETNQKVDCERREVKSVQEGQVDPGNTQTTEFIEDGEIINMEINDGGAAAREFGSEFKQDDPEESDRESDDPEMDHETSVDEVNNTCCENEAETDQSFAEEESPQEQRNTPKKRAENKRAKKRSLEVQLENMSSTLEVMKDFFLSQMDVTQTGGGRGKKQTGNEMTEGCAPSPSETTIYHNALNQATNEQERLVDPEITFCFNKGGNKGGSGNPMRNSSSSKDQIDTSDELMEVDDEQNITDCFIADCEREAKRRRSED